MQHLHRQKLCDLWKKDGFESTSSINVSESSKKKSSSGNDIIFVAGASVSHRYGTDFEYPFRQESNFLYLTGVQEPDFSLILVPSTGEYHLFSPRRDAMYAVWMGFVRTQDELNKAYSPDHIHFTDELDAVLKSINPGVVHCVTETDAASIRKSGFNAETGTLADALAYCRVIKTESELDELRKASKVASLAHRSVLSALAPDKREYEMMALFQYECVRRGYLHQPYSGIHAGGTGAAVLHYVENNRKLRDGDMYLIDAGAESNGYASDFTRTWPTNGKFSSKQAQLYDIALEMLETSIANTRAGVEMENLHLDAARVLTERFKEAGFIRGDTEELMKKNIFALFFPHGLGHFLGLDTHDVGGYPKGVERIDRPGLRYLRARRLLEPGMVITIEPGIYFIPALLKPAFENPEQSKYLNISVLKEYLDFGGIRIEDNLIITSDGHENMTDVPKFRKDFEK